MIRSRLRSSLRLVTCVAVVLGLLLVQTAFAAKPTVAILGLEVIDNGSGFDAKTTQFAKELTEELRKRPKAGAPPYALAPGSDKDLLELKLLSGCENEGKDCMAAIGTDLAADRLLYGKVEKRKDGYQVSLKLLNVQTKANEKSISEIIPINEATGANLASWGKKLYAKLTGATDQGTLVIKANVDRGTVYVDGQVKANLAGGQARIAGLSEGKYTIAIEAEGHLRYEANVNVEASDDNVHQADLEKNPIRGGGDNVRPPDGGRDGDGDGDPDIVTGTVSSDERPGGGYRALFWTSLALTAGGSAGIAVMGLQVRNQDKDDQLEAVDVWQNRSGMTLDEADACSDAENRLGDLDVEAPDQLRDVVNACDTGKRHAMITNVLIGATAVTALATVIFYYKGYVASKSSTEAVNRGMAKKRKKDKAPVVVAPIVGPTQVGAGVRIIF